MWGMFTVSNVTTQPPPGSTPFRLDTSLMIVLGVVLGSSRSS